MFLGRFITFQKKGLCKSKMSTSSGIAVVKFNFQKNKNFFPKSYSLLLFRVTPIFVLLHTGCGHCCRIQPDSNMQLIEQEFFIGTIPI